MQLFGNPEKAGLSIVGGFVAALFLASGFAQAGGAPADIQILRPVEGLWYEDNAERDVRTAGPSQVASASGPFTIEVSWKCRILKGHHAQVEIKIKEGARVVFGETHANVPLEGSRTTGEYELYMSGQYVIEAKVKCFRAKSLLPSATDTDRVDLIWTPTWPPVLLE